MPDVPAFNGVRHSSEALRRWVKRVRIWQVLAEQHRPANELALMLYQAIGGVAAIDGAAGGGIERDERRISGEVA